MISGGYELLLYIQGGVIGRGGTYTVTTGAGAVSQDHVDNVPFEGAYIEGSEGNYLRFSGLSGTEFRIETMATTPATGTRRAPLNGIEVCAPSCTASCRRRSLGEV